MHIAVFPWLAMGHLIPYLRLSILLAEKGHTISFISTPRNLQRLPKIPSNLSNLISLVSIPLPTTPLLPPNAESSTDIPPKLSQILKSAFDSLKPPLSAFLQSNKPHWIVHDYASYWLPPLATSIGSRSAFFSLFTAAFLCFNGPPTGDGRSSIQDYLTVPKWVPFETDVVYRYHEMAKNAEGAGDTQSGVLDQVRFGTTVIKSDVVVIRSCPEFEPKWVELLGQLYGTKPIVPLGFLPPKLRHEEDGLDEKWILAKRFLDRKTVGSVVYVAFGSEATLKVSELEELALGLERSELPFLWVMRSSSETLPKGFEERVEGHGMVLVWWAQQVSILRHESIGGFLTHCGWNSIVEGLGLGKVLILLPMLNDQGLNARLLEGEKLGVEIPRNEGDGSFTSELVSETVRFAMVEEAGEELRDRAKEVRGMFGDGDFNGRYFDRFLAYLEFHATENQLP